MTTKAQAPSTTAPAMTDEQRARLAKLVMQKSKHWKTYLTECGVEFAENISLRDLKALFDKTSAERKEARLRGEYLPHEQRRSAGKWIKWLKDHGIEPVETKLNQDGSIENFKALYDQVQEGKATVGSQAGKTGKVALAKVNQADLDFMADLL